MTSRNPAVPPALVDVRAVVGRPVLTALGVGTGGAALLAVAPLLPVATARDGAATSAAYPAAPLLAVLALGCVALAWTCALRGSTSLAAGVLTGVAVVAPGRLLQDLQLVVDPWRAARPELTVATSLAPLRPGLGAFALVAGHALTIAAGVLAARHLAGTAAAVGVGGLAGAGADGDGLGGDADATARVPRRAVAAAFTAAALAALGLVLAPFGSTDPYLAPTGAADAPGAAAVGTLVLALAIMVAAALAAGAPDAVVGSGVLFGLAAAVAAVAAPSLAAAVADEVTLGAGPCLALAGAAGLAVAGRFARATAVDRDGVDDDPGATGGAAGGAAGSRRGAAGSAAGRSGTARAAGSASADVVGELPTLDRLHTIAGALAAVAGVAALLGATVSAVRVGAGLTAPVLTATRLLAPAGVVLVVLAAGLLAARWQPRWPAIVRPALTVAWAAVALAAFAALDGALTALGITGVEAGAGSWAAAIALVTVIAAAVVAAVAGGVERDDVDLSEPRTSTPALVAGIAAAALAVPAFALPVITAPGYAAPGVWSNFQFASWGLVAALGAVVAAALLAPRSRPARAVALLGGALAVVATHVSQAPLIGERGGAPTSPGAGAWCAVACAVALAVGTALAWRERGRV